MRARADAALFERERELALLHEQVELVRLGSGAVVAIEGPPGIGKSQLLEATCAAAASAGVCVLSARPSELELGLGWVVVRALLEARLRSLSEEQREVVFSGAARLALPVLGHDGEVALPAGADGKAAAMHGLHWLVANLSELAPLLIAVDDAHWADQSSREWLGYLAARISGLPVGMVVAARPAEPGAARDVLRLLPDATVLRPDPLSEDATVELLRGAWSPGAEAAFCRACHHASAGNPFALNELISDLEANGVAPRDVNVARVESAGPEAVAASVLRRVARLEASAQRLAEVVAVLGSRVLLADAAALAQLDERTAAQAADALADAGVLARGLPLDFAHPLMRSAVYEHLPRAEVAVTHGRAARLLTERGADDDEIAVHLLEIEPSADRGVVERMIAAAETAIARGAPGVAARYLHRALREPPTDRERPQLLYLLGQAETAVLGPAGLDAFEEAVELHEVPEERARVALEFSRAARMMAEFPRSTRVLARVADSLDAWTPLSLRVDGELINVAVLDLATMDAARERLERYVDPDASSRLRAPGLLADLAIITSSAAMPYEIPAGFARRAVAALGDGEPDPSATVYTGVTLMFCEQYEEAGAVWDRFMAHARETGSMLAYAFGSCFHAQLAYRIGEIRLAEEDARAAVATFREWGARPVEPSCFLAAALTQRGELEEAAGLLGSATPSELPGLWDNTQLLHTRGRVRLAQNQTALALDDLRECGRRLELMGSRNPSHLPWRSDAALALRQLEELDEARALVDEEVEIAREFGTPRALGVALRGKGLIDGGNEGIALLEEAVNVLVGSPARVVRAQALYDLGAALRRSGRRADAREPLRQALELASRAGATHLADQARGELVTAGARPRRDRIEGRDALTASEVRVAELAAEGRSNREIAQDLFVTRRTVETHLTHIYRKLKITKRTELKAKLEVAREPVRA